MTDSYHIIHLTKKNLSHQETISAENCTEKQNIDKSARIQISLVWLTLMHDMKT